MSPPPHAFRAAPGALLVVPGAGCGAGPSIAAVQSVGNRGG